MSKKLPIMKILKLIILFVLPAVTIFFYIRNAHTAASLAFSAYVLFIIFERVFESLYLSKDKNKDELEGDWSLPVSAVSYIVLILLCLVEFYFAGKPGFNWGMTMVAFAAYLLAMGLRFWAVLSLGDQWSVHITGKDKLAGKRVLISKGPYRFIRHPVYLGIIIEQISIPLVFNLYITAIMAALFSIPLQIVKARLEEKAMSGYFGEEYMKFTRTTPAFCAACGLIKGRTCK